MYQEPEKYEVLRDNWLKKRVKELQNMSGKDRKRLFNNPVDFIAELFEDFQKLH